VRSTHRTIIAVILGLAIVAGLFGLTRTLDLGAATTPSATASPAALAKSSHRLDRVEATLRHARASRPPALPTIPKYPASAPAPTSVVNSAPAQPAVQRVTYVRPPPHVVIVPRAGGEGDDGGEHEGSDGSDD
jgi:hypothetical protein